MDVLPWLQMRYGQIEGPNPDVAGAFYARLHDATLAERFKPANLKLLLPEFIAFFRGVPIPDNTGGMGFWHAFALWNFLSEIKPAAVVESGIYRGLSTWMIENLLPEARVISLDPAMKQRIYISTRSNVTYSSIDLRYQDFSEFDGIERDKVLVFVDDHNNHMDRLAHLNYFGFTQAVFDDNYFPHGDCISLKHIIHREPYDPFTEIGGNQEGKAALMYMRNGMLLQNNNRAVNVLSRKLTCYAEFAAPFLDETGRNGQLPPVFSGTTDPDFTALPKEIQEAVVKNDFAYSAFVRLAA
ncbi:MAG: hypothetical protein A3G18_02595 [Rhodospirillales bacterium RIFCSPLOWO2_12_FULL_58_28]|nr:MAG: hypothetical protein A3H92_06645 [Rhodospirillales bacterium RIFCSPLOWO2_02_FULL_58_16]OHC78940.1 MAG: hypothetical protein A3G18_02595 [Rhodospirillales bacterium RIFCSPLOWO2_12_FULL_58_28]